MHIEQKTNRIFRPIGNTTLSAEETNQVTTEIENQITAGGLTPNASTLTQLRDSIQNVVDTAANDLQSQIDAIISSSDVFDVVGTYAQLQAYDTSTVPVNDIIKVLQDETRQNAMTYYRWNGTTWVFIGAEGPYYTVAETDTKFALKTQLPGIATTQQAGLVKPDGQSVLIGQDGTLSVAQTMSASLPLFTCQFTDHLLNDASYLRADTFSWNSGAVYISSYQHLVDDIAGKTAETETISGTTITFYRATDGHKIVLADQESNVSAIYAATGVSWYYILDTVNTRFKLPRMLPLGDTAPVVGNGMTLGLTNGTDNLGPSTLTGQAIYGGFGVSTEFYGKNIGTQGTLTYTYDGSVGVTTDSTKSGLIANLSHTSNDGAYKFLYFYCGNTVQSQTTIDVGQITETLNGKADTDLGNVSATSGFRRLVEVSDPSIWPSWYKVFDEYDPATGTFVGKWCEQGGKRASMGTDTSLTVNLLKPFSSTDYAVLNISIKSGTSSATASSCTFGMQTTSTFVFYQDTSGDLGGYWRAYGYIS